MFESEMRVRRREPKSDPRVEDQWSPFTFKKESLILISRRRWLLIIAVFVSVFVVVTHLNNRLPRAVLAMEAGDTQFSEERARLFLTKLTALGPRTTGAMTSQHNVLEVFEQHPTGCFPLKFFDQFVNCYQNVTNIIVRIGRSSVPAPSLLLNCHYDSFISSPGASDDGVNCAIMLDLLYIFSKVTAPLKNDIIFLFNGAEENVLEGSHGFITLHDLRHSVKAFINLEGAGASGREVLFQSGPQNYWLLQTYVKNVPYPHCSTLAQEIFQSGKFPGETDFRIFWHYGNLSGLDIAYFRNGYVYHNEFDRPEFIASGAIQRTGDNLLTLVRATLLSSCLETDCPQQTQAFVFFDLFGLFTVSYLRSTSVVFNLSLVLVVLLKLVSSFTPG
ncbi:unnamed protein product [Soboliphyme baturini]|uniref:FXNA-like protease n=1 Tax=Soboliphyme baturini TaxID=241478 RepID=A0A183IRJ6_9BILA|nr:unnamed protein product [Soboliphyme baturini]